MQTTTVEVPEDALRFLQQSRLGMYPQAEQVRIALALHLFQEGFVSAGRAAELAGLPRANFELLLVELGIPVVHYDVADYEQDRRAWEEFRQHATVP